MRKKKENNVFIFVHINAFERLYIDRENEPFANVFPRFHDSSTIAMQTTKENDDDNNTRHDDNNNNNNNKAKIR